MNIDKNRLLSIFEQLLLINSPSGKEEPIVEKILEITAELPLEIIKLASVNKTKNNLILKLPAYNCNNNKSLLFSAHLDTVESTQGIKLLKNDSLYRTDGSTILGSDDKSGIAAILESLFILSKNERPHPKIEACFTVEEEIGLKGANALDFSMIESKRGIVLDCDGDVGKVVNEAPSQINFKVTIKGKAAHAGIDPENGKNAILFAARVIYSLPLGRIDQNTTANIGTIKGGKANNIVPDLVELTGEIRSRDDNMLNSVYETFLSSFKEGEKEGYEVEFESEKTYSSFKVDENDFFIQLLKDSSGDKIIVKCMPSGGGSDGNVFNRISGLKCINLATGMEKVHTHEEFILIDNLLILTDWIINIAYKYC